MSGHKKGYRSALYTASYQYRSKVFQVAGSFAIIRMLLKDVDFSESAREYWSDQLDLIERGIKNKLKDSYKKEKDHLLKMRALLHPTDKKTETKPKKKSNA